MSRSGSVPHSPSPSQSSPVATFAQFFEGVEDGHSSAPTARAAQSSTRPAHFWRIAFRSLPPLGVETRSHSWYIVTIFP